MAYRSMYTLLYLYRGERRKGTIRGELLKEGRGELLKEGRTDSTDDARMNYDVKRVKPCHSSYLAQPYIKKMTTWTMRIGYLGAETCSCANTLFSGVENKGQYAVFPISPR